MSIDLTPLRRIEADANCPDCHGAGYLFGVPFECNCIWAQIITTDDRDRLLDGEIEIVPAPLETR